MAYCLGIDHFKGFTLDFSIYREDSNASNFEFRDAANRRFLVSFESGQVRFREHDGTTWTTPDTNPYVLTPGQWYDVKVVADGGYIEVWAGPQGQAPEKLLETDTTVVGNRKQIIFVSSPNSNVRFDNIALSVPDPEIATYYTYDAWGRTSSRYQGDGSAIHANYVYRFGDKLKLLTSTFPGEAATMAYNYDGLGRRRNAWEGYPNGAPTWYRWEGWQELGSYAHGAADWDIGDIERYYIPGLAEVAGDVPGGQNAEWRYYLTDHLGSVRGILGEGREALARYAYTPYGETALQAGLPLHVGFTGHTWEPETGQYFAPFRYYSPGNGRWLTRDPLGFVDGPNVYGYVGGDPARKRDRFGLQTATVTGGLCGGPWGAIGGAIVDGLLILGAMVGVLIAVPVLNDVADNVDHGDRSSDDAPPFPPEVIDWGKRLVDDPDTPPPGFSRGGPKENYYNPGTGESLRPDPDHGGDFGPHTDYRPGQGKPWYRIFPDGRCEPKIPTKR